MVPDFYFTEIPDVNCLRTFIFVYLFSVCMGEGTHTESMCEVREQLVGVGVLHHVRPGD